jgi:hypothetical protein
MCELAFNAAWARHGMCELAFNAAWERHGMCELAFNAAWERHGMCESGLIVRAPYLWEQYPRLIQHNLLLLPGVKRSSSIY